MQKLKLLSLLPLLLAAVLSQPHQAHADPITPGNLVVVRIGDGSAALTSAATATFLDVYTTSGMRVPLQSIALPTTASGSNAAFTNSGSASSEGALDLSSDGRYLTLAGYNTTPGTLSVAGTTSDSVNRVVARVDAVTGAVDTTTRIPNAYSGNNIRGATTADGTTFYTAGNGAAGAAGTQSERLGVTGSTAIDTTLNNTRTTNIYNGNLYFSTASTPAGTSRGIYSLGTSPTGTTTPTLLLGTGASSTPDAFFVTPDGNTVYVADETAAVGLQKYVRPNSSSSFSLAYQSGAGIRGLAFGGIGTDGKPLFYATNATGNTILSLTDSNDFSFSGMGSFASATIATADPNTVFRGIAVTPVPEPTTIAMLLMGLSGIGGTKLKKRKKRATS